MLENSLVNVHETIELRGEELKLLPEKAIYWPSKKILLIADLHLGKAAHFRNNGIAIPSTAAVKNWDLLNQLFKEYKPERVCFLGDLFHSTHNKEWEAFSELIKGYSNIQFELVIGNHDILPHQLYEELGIVLYTELIEKPFILTHEPVEEESVYYKLAGHIHPGVRLKGKGKQSHRAPCFYFEEKGGILPAFGALTGLAIVKVKKKDRVYMIVNSTVLSIND